MCFYYFPNSASFWNCSRERKQELMFKVFALNVNFTPYFIFVGLDYCLKVPSHKAKWTGTGCVSQTLQRVWGWKRTVGKMGYRIQACVLQLSMAAGPVCYLFFSFTLWRIWGGGGEINPSPTFSQSLLFSLLPPCSFLPQLYQQPLLG